MSSTSAAFTAPAWYDEHLATATFGPFAAQLVARLPRDLPGPVLEIACGTGVLTRPLREHLRPDVALTATDLSPAMLAYARERSAAQAGIAWREADAAQLPFADGSFGAVVCGFGFMFPPDRQAAFAQARRVLRSGGRLAFSVWDTLEQNPHALAAAELIEGLFPGDTQMKFRVPYELADPGLLMDLLSAARFGDVRIDTVRLPVEAPDPALFAAGQIRGTPRSAVLAQRGVDLDQVIERLAAALVAQGGSPYRGSAQALLVQAIAR